MNPLYNLFGNNSLMRQFMQFKSTFQGDPREQVQQLLNSGKISQEQYNQAVQQAKALQEMLKM